MKEKDIRALLKCQRVDAKRILGHLIEIQSAYDEYASPEGTFCPELFFQVFGKSLGLK